MKDFILEPTDGFELLRVWEASKFASPALSRQPIDMTLDQKRKSFGVESARSLPSEMQQPPLLCFNGEPIEHRQDLAVLLNCSRLVGQYKTYQGNYVVLVSANAKRDEQQLLKPSHFTWNGGHVYSRNRIDMFSLLFAYCFNPELKITSLLRFGHQVCAKPETQYSSPDGDVYMYDSVESTKLGDDGLIIRFWRGPAVALDFLKEYKLGQESISLGYRVTNAPFTGPSAHVWSRPQHYVQGEWFPNDSLLNLTVLPYRSWLRLYKQELSPKLKTSDLIQLDPIEGWREYQGGDVVEEMQAQLSL